MALALESERNEPLAQLGIITAAAAGVRGGHLDDVRWAINPQGRRVAVLDARDTIDSTTAALVLEARYPRELLTIVGLETLQLAAGRAVVPAGHIRVLGGSKAWVCNARPERDGLWCGVLIVFAPGRATLQDWDSGRSVDVEIPAGVAGGTGIKLRWAGGDYAV